MHIYKKLLEETPDGHFLIADTAFPRNGDGLANKIKTPLKHGGRFPRGTTRAQAQNMVAYSNAITSARQAVEWGMRAIQGAFGRLRMPLDINDPVGRRTLIETCLRLHNLRTRRIGNNQIRTVYMSNWGSAQSNFLENLHDMMFQEIRQNDRVRRFYVELEMI